MPPFEERKNVMSLGNSGYVGCGCGSEAYGFGK